jgi:hypothetical protein
LCTGFAYTTSHTQGCINPVRANCESDILSPRSGGFRANIFLDPAETLIMKFPFLPVAFLLLFIIAIIAGCSSSTSSPGYGQSSSDLKPWEVGTPVPYTDLPQLLLSRSEIPFAVANENTLEPDMAEPAFSQYGAIRGFTRFSISQKEESATSVQLGQTIVEYPPGNATKAYDAFIAQTKNSDMTLYTISMSPDLGIGQRSCILVISDRAGTAKPITMLVFAKSNIMESVTMISPTSDLTTLTRVGKLAAAKIP